MALDPFVKRREQLKIGMRSLLKVMILFYILLWQCSQDYIMTKIHQKVPFKLMNFLIQVIPQQIWKTVLFF